MASEPTVLAFDTAAAHCAAVLLRGETVLAARAEEMARGQAERLLPLLEEVLAEAGSAWPDITRIGVGVGPGNFTGIRIGVAAARGLALSLNVPAVGVSGLEVAAFGLPRPVMTTVAAPRAQCYTQSWSDHGPTTAPELCLRDTLSAPPVPVALEDIPLTERARRIALIARATPDPISRPSPLYVRPADAALPREPAPVILERP